MPGESEDLTVNGQDLFTEQEYGQKPDGQDDESHHPTAEQDRLDSGIVVSHAVPRFLIGYGIS